MRIISIKKLKDFWESGRADAEQPIKAWYYIFKKNFFGSPQEIKSVFPSASFIGNNKVVFNISGNKYRLVVFIKYELQIVFIKFIGSHSEYDKINIKEL